MVNFFLSFAHMPPKNFTFDYKASQEFFVGSKSLKL